MLVEDKLHWVQLYFQPRVLRAGYHLVGRGGEEREGEGREVEGRGGEGRVERGEGRGRVERGEGRGRVERGKWRGGEGRGGEGEGERGEWRGRGGVIPKYESRLHHHFLAIPPLPPFPLLTDVLYMAQPDSHARSATSPLLPL